MKASLQSQVQELRTKIRGLEDQLTKAHLSHDKDQALREQKAQFIEQENKRVLMRLEELLGENKELAKRLQESESELKQAGISLKVKEEEKRKEMEILKEHYQKKLEEKKGDSSAVADLER